MSNQYKISVKEGPTKIMKFGEGVSQTFKAGDIVKIGATTSGGYVIAAASSDAKLLGIALGDASGTTATSILVLVILQDTELVSSVYHSTAASAITAQTQVGATYDLIIGTHAGYIDIEHTADNIFTVVELIPDDAIGTVYGRVGFTVKGSALQYYGAGTLD